jgi:hypothetical protein
MNRTIKWVGALAAALALSAGSGFYAYYLAPPPAARLPLADDLIAVSSDRGRQLLAESQHSADLDQLGPAFVPQRRRAFCGPATSATLINAALRPAQPVTQFSLFDGAASQIKSELDVSMSGLSLEELAGLLQAHGLAVRTVLAGQATIDAFRRDAQHVLSEPHTYLVVNYDRRALGQVGPGHISPVGAYHADTDHLLVMDVAAYKYPHTWVPLPRLWAAMSQPVAGRTRGYLLVSAGDESAPRR